MYKLDNSLHLYLLILYMEKHKYRVVIRVNSHDPNENAITSTEDTIDLFNVGAFTFSRVFTPGSSEEVFEFLKPSISECFKGVNINVIGYQISGRLNTIVSEEGLIKETLRYLFENEMRYNFTYSCSMMTITDDTIQDLLQQPGRAQRFVVKKDLNNLIIIENLAEFVVERAGDCEFLLTQGLSSAKNLPSDTSTLIFQLILESRKANIKGLFTKSKINFIDLAPAGKSFAALKACLTCLANKSTVPYKDSKLTQVLADSLNYSSVNLFVASVSPLFQDAADTLEGLSVMNIAGKIDIDTVKNTYSGTARNPQLDEEIFKLKNAVKQKKKHDEVWAVKEENENLKKILNKKTAIEEVEDLINENKVLRLELQQLIGRPLAENDLEHPESFQDALLLTEDLIKKRKLDLASSEMKEKLLNSGRCQICTLKLPCKHSDAQALAVIEKPKQCLELALVGSNTPTFLTGSDIDGPKRFRIRSCRGRGEIMHKKEEDKDEKMIREAEKRLNVLSKIEAYREERLRKEIEKMETEAKIEKGLIEQKKALEEKKKKYYEMQKEKIYEFMEQKKLEEAKTVKKNVRPKSHIVRNRPQSNIKIRDYEQKKNLVAEILRYQTKLIRKSMNKEQVEEKIADSVDLLYNN